MNNQTSVLKSTPSAIRILIAIASLRVLVHLMTSWLTDYGYFIDEFYYIACSKRLAFGYVDQPPLSAWLLAANRWLLGDSLPALRFLPALAGGVTVLLAGLLTRLLGGGKQAQIMAAIATFCAPVYLLFSSFYSMNPFELLIWTASTYLLIRILIEDKPELWLWVGVLVGIGLEFKHTMILYVFAFLLALMLTRGRKYLVSKWFWIGWAISFIILVPNLIWQMQNGFPSLEFYRNATIYKNIPTPPLGVLAGQVLFVNPISMALALLGAWYFLRSGRERSLHVFGYMFIVLLIIMIIGQSSRPDRIGAMYPVLFAGGAIAVEELALKRSRKWLPRLATGILIAGGLVLAPIAVPFLPPDALIRYMAAIGFHFNIEQGKEAQLPQWFADRFGWKELVAEVGRVYSTLSPSEQANCVILAGSYGQAGALELFGAQYHLPRVICNHNSYHLWGPCSDSVQTYITVLVSRQDLEHKFREVVEGGIHTCKYCMNYERRLPIYIARGPTFSIQQEWPFLKHYE